MKKCLLFPGVAYDVVMSYYAAMYTQSLANCDLMY